MEKLALHGGVATRQTLASHLNMPLSRLPGFIAAVRRVLNVDGYMVLGDENPRSVVT